jgi:Fic family protein
VEKTVHAFEAGNGRLGRDLAEKSLAKNIGQPGLIALALTTERQRKACYDQLEKH